LGLSTRKSWLLTPREFHALERVYLDKLERWGFERAHSAALAGAKHESGRPFSVADFVSTPAARAQRNREEAERLELAALKRAEQRQMRAMKAAMKAGRLDEEGLPGWARMTQAEKAQRGLN